MPLDRPRAPRRPPEPDADRLPRREARRAPVPRPDPRHPARRAELIVLLAAAADQMAKVLDGKAEVSSLRYFSDAAAKIIDRESDHE